MEKTIEAWVKMEGIGIYCPIVCFGKHGSVIIVEESKITIKNNELIIGNYWNNGTSWCFSLFPRYTHLSS